MPVPRCDLPDVAWVSARDGSRAPGDLEDQAARYHPARHELTINADFRAITDLTAHWRPRYRAIPDAQRVTDGHVREWCEQILVEVVLAAHNSIWDPEQLDALLSPASFTAALLPRHLLHATIQTRLGQKLGAPRGDAGGTSPDSRTRDLPPGRAAAELRRRTGQKPGGQAGWIRPSNHRLGAKRTRAVAARSRRGRMLRCTRDAAAPAGATGLSTGAATAGTIYGKHPGAVPVPVAHTGRDPRRARTSARRPGTRAGTSIRSGCECPRRFADARACRRYPCSVLPERFCARGRFAGTYSPVLAGFCSRQEHRYQWRSCHRKCRIYRQKVHRRP